MVFGDEVGRGSSPVRGGKRRVGPGGRGGGDRCAFKVAPELATEAATATPTEARSHSCPARCSWGAVPGCIGEAEVTVQWGSAFFRPILRLGGACSNAGEGLVKFRSSDSGATFFNIGNDEADFDGDGGKRYFSSSFSGEVMADVLSASRFGLERRSKSMAVAAYSMFEVPCWASRGGGAGGGGRRRRQR